MKIELKNVKYAEFASDETHCFEASIWIDRKKTGTTVRNDGHGGCNFYHGGDAYERLTAYAKTLPAETTDLMVNGEPFMFQPDADSIVGDVLEDWLHVRDSTGDWKTCRYFRGGVSAR